MPGPNSALLTLRPDLRSLEQFDLQMDRLGFIGTRVLPVIDVARASGNFGRLKLEELLREADVNRGSKGNYNRDEYGFDPLTFATAEKGFEGRVDDNEASIYSDYFDLEQITASRVIDTVLRASERRAAKMIFNTTTFTGAQQTDATLLNGVTATPKWSDTAGSIPIDTVESMVLAFWNRTGLWPNALILEMHALRLLRQNAQIIDSIKSSGAGDRATASDVTIDKLRDVLQIDQIIVAGSATNTANPGQARTVAPIWDKTMAMVTRVATTNDIKEPCIGRTFHYAGDGSEATGTTETYRDETVRADIVRCRHQVNEQIIYSEMGQLLINVQ